MSTEFINLSEIYLPSAGGSIDGDVEVGGALTVNDGTGAGTTYDLAYEISQLRAAWDSVSPYTKDNWLIIPLGNGYVQLSRNVTHTNVSITTLWGDIYESTQSYGNLTFPVTFTEIPVMTLTAVKTNVYCIGSIETCGENTSITTTNTGEWLYTRGTSASGIDVTTSIIVIGKVS